MAVAPRSSVPDVLPDDRDLGGKGNRADLRGVVAAGAYLLGKVADLLDERVVHRLDDVGHFEADAAVSGVLHGAPDDVPGGFVQVGVLGHDDTVLSAEFQQNGGQALRALGGHGLAGGDAAGERELVQAGLDECLARGPEPVEALKDVREVGDRALPGPDEPLPDAGRDLAGLEDGGVSGRDRLDQDGPRREQGEVPRADDTDDAVGLVFDPRALVGHGGTVRDVPTPQHALGVLDGVLHVLQNPEHLHTGFVQRLAVLGVDESDSSSPLMAISRRHARSCSARPSNPRSHQGPETERAAATAAAASSLPATGYRANSAPVA